MNILSYPIYYVIDPISREDALSKLEKIARTCYQSEDRTGPGTASRLVTKLMKRGHTAMLEHVSVSVHFTADRGFSHELVRHRLASYAQESTRWCNYGKEIGVLLYPDIENNAKAKEVWMASCECAEQDYKMLLNAGMLPQSARAVLPICTVTNIDMTADLTEWLHIFNLRVTHRCHPVMHYLMSSLLKLFSNWLPEVYSDMYEAKMSAHELREHYYV